MKESQNEPRVIPPEVRAVLDAILKNLNSDSTLKETSSETKTIRIAESHKDRLNNQDINIRIVLTGKIKQLFLEIKHDLEIKSNKEALIYIILDYYKLRIQKTEKR